MPTTSRICVSIVLFLSCLCIPAVRGQDEISPQPGNEPSFDPRSDPEFDPHSGVDAVPRPQLSHTRAFLETAGFNDLKTVFEEIRSGAIEPNDEVDPMTLCRALLRSEGFEGEEYIQKNFRDFSIDERLELTPMLGHFGRSLGTFMVLIEELPDADGYMEALLTAAANLMTKRMRDDETWKDAVAFDLNRYTAEEIEFASYFIAKAGGEVSRVLLFEALATHDNAKLVPVLRSIAGLPFDDESIVLVGELLANSNEEIGVRMAAISALRRCELRGLPQLVQGFEAVSREPESEQNLALKRFIRQAMVKITRGVDYGDNPEAWGTHLQTGPVPFDSDVPVRPDVPKVEDGVPHAVISGGVALILAVLALVSVAFKKSLGPAVVLSPLAIGFIIASVVQMLPEESAKEQVGAGPPIDMTLEVASRLSTGLLQYLEDRQNEGGSGRPPFAALRCSPGVLNGQAFAPFSKRLAQAEKLQVVRVHKRLAKAYLHLNDGKILTAKVEFLMQEGEARVTDFKPGLILTGSRPEGAAAGPSGAQPSATVTEQKGQLVRWFATTFCILTACVLGLCFYLSSKLRPWEAVRTAPSIRQKAEPKKKDADKDKHLERSMRQIGRRMEADQPDEDVEKPPE